MCKNHKLLFVTALIFFMNQTSNGKILLGLCQGNQSDDNLQVDQQKYVKSAALCR